MKHKCRAASAKVGGGGTHYTVMIGGHESFLFNEDEKWLVEVQKSFFGSAADDPAIFALPTPIDQVASDYGWRFYDMDQVKIDTFCGAFGVSKSAAAIRLEQLGYHGL